MSTVSTQAATRLAEPAQAGLSFEAYQSLYRWSMEDPEGFWREQGRRLHWFQPYTRIEQCDFNAENPRIAWYEDGSLNAAYNCLDRHLKQRADKTAILWEPDDPSLPTRRLSYRDLHTAVCRFANGLKQRGIGKGDRVAIYMPMVPEAAVAMLACARIGAIHTVIFGGFSPQAIADRIQDCQAKAIITADESRRGGQGVALKGNVDKALADNDCSSLETVVVLETGDRTLDWHGARDVSWSNLTRDVSDDCPAEEMSAEDPLFILYTSGSTGKPKGVLHTTGGYLVHASLSHEVIFDLQEDDVYWCAADVGWITGHSYIVYGPLANGATTVMFEGVPTWPDAGRIGEIIDKHQVSILYTAPTLVRALMAKGSQATEASERKSLRLLGSVGEPINPEAWQWYHDEIGCGDCPIVDTWWQTETGGVLISPLPSTPDLKPGSAMLPFFGVEPALMDQSGRELTAEAPSGQALEGNLVIKRSWPGQARTLWGNHQRFAETYFSAYPGCYFPGDGARRDEDGHWWITGRVDDVLNVSGHRLGTAEIESALVAHAAVAEAAVVGYPHDIKGQGIYVYVTLSEDAGQGSDQLRRVLKDQVRKELSPIATPDVIQWADGLPKTRSGKIMRRILRKIAAAEYDQLGDTSTLADPAVVESLIQEHKHLMS
ncbi:acetyl-CoA synthetase [Natronospira proteinivora]|uniref:Acetyl-coenzyme A synthetase n=1 Tax=Natronospira proteinivora TaxID=1807133 RepID=A0ABT1GBI6_9GAMM|nr:acetate--CoA ligase [Natronospira proteinivora]MCP1728427.1 acetyl-CoA synthetase [Natronospira proteinivora]